MEFRAVIDPSLKPSRIGPYPLQHANLRNDSTRLYRVGGEKDDQENSCNSLSSRNDFNCLG